MSWKHSVARSLVAVAATLAVGAGLLGATSEPAHAKEAIIVTVDRAKVMRINTAADTVIVGNPAVADAVMHNPNTLIIVGRSNGTTNLIVLDQDSKPIADEVIVVRAPESTIVTVQRKNQQFSYSCAPNCAPAPRPGDFVEFFENTAKQTANRNAEAQAAAKGAN